MLSYFEMVCNPKFSSRQFLTYIPYYLLYRYFKPHLLGFLSGEMSGADALADALGTSLGARECSADEQVGKSNFKNLYLLFSHICFS